MPYGTGKIITTMVIVAAALAAGITYGQCGSQATTSVGIREGQVPEYETKVWQGSVERVSKDSLVVKVEGEHEEFRLAPDATVRKDRKSVDFQALHRGDFATLRSIERGKREVVVSVQAFSLRN